MCLALILDPNAVPKERTDCIHRVDKGRGVQSTVPSTGSDFNGEPQLHGTTLPALLAGLPWLFCGANCILMDGGTRSRAFPQLQRPIPAPGPGAVAAFAGRMSSRFRLHEEVCG